MNVAMSVRLGVVVASILFSFAQPANAGLFRAYLSSTGSDANPCTVVAPCRLLPAALSAVNDGGKIWMLDSANYNTSTVNIGKSVTIVAMPGIIGSVVSTNASDAIDISGSHLQVALSNLSIVPLGTTASGIFFTSVSGGRLDVEDCRITGMVNDGINVSASNTRVKIKNTILRLSGLHGFFADGTVTAALDGVQITANRVGVLAHNQSQVNVTNSVLADDFVGAASSAETGGPTQLVVSHSTLTGNTIGLLAAANPGQDGSLVSDTNVLTFVNDTVFSFQNDGGTETIFTRGNNTAGYYNILITSGHVLTALDAI